MFYRGLFQEQSLIFVFFCSFLTIDVVYSTKMPSFATTTGSAKIVSDSVLKHKPLLAMKTDSKTAKMVGDVTYARSFNFRRFTFN